MSTSTVSPASNASQAATSRMSLANVIKGKLRRPRRVLLYGTEGIGKSTFGAQAPAPIFITSEDGAAELDIERYPQAHQWDDVLAAIQDLTVSEHGYKSLVIDTLDWLEPMIHAHVCAKNGWANMEALDYGKCYVPAMNEWRVLLARLDALRARRGMQVILLAHSQVKQFKSPMGEAYDRYELKLLHTKSAAIIKEWCDAMLFVRYEDLAAKQGKRMIGVSTGARLVQTEHRATWDAKNRYGLPEVLTLSWAAFDEACEAGHAGQASEHRAEIDALLAQVDEDTRSKAEEYLAKNGAKPDGLAKLADRLRAKVALANTHQPADAGGKEVAA